MNWIATWNKRAYLHSIKLKMCNYWPTIIGIQNKYPFKWWNLRYFSIVQMTWWFKLILLKPNCVRILQNDSQSNEYLENRVIFFFIVSFKKNNLWKLQIRKTCSNRLKIHQMNWNGWEMTKSVNDWNGINWQANRNEPRTKKNWKHIWHSKVQMIN